MAPDVFQPINEDEEKSTNSQGSEEGDSESQKSNPVKSQGKLAPKEYDHDINQHITHEDLGLGPARKKKKTWSD